MGAAKPPKPPNPFNPGSQVDPGDFVGRIQELENFRQKLRQTAEGLLANMAVAGGYGIGKTSFLHKCKSIAEAEGALAVYFSVNELVKIDKKELADTLIERIKDKVEEEVILQRLSAAISGILKSISIRSSTEGSTTGIELRFERRGKNYPNLQSALAAAWKALQGSKKCIVFLIDEAGILEKNKAELLLYLRAVLEQLQVERVPVMIIPAGKLSITGPTGTGFSPLMRTFPPVILVNFTKAETSEFIGKKIGKTGMKTGVNACDIAYQVSEGHPYVLTAYLNAAYSKILEGEWELSERHFRAADIEFVRIILSPFFSRFYDHVGKSSREILMKIAEKPNSEISLSELTDSLGKSNNQLSPFLAKLVQDGAVLRVERGRYRLFHHLLSEYILASRT